MDQHTTLVTAVREALKQTSMRKLAAKAGVSHTTISALLSGKSSDVSLKTYQRLMTATATDRGLNADIGQRDTELECAKYKRVMALEAEVQAWKGKVLQAETLAQVTAKDLQTMTASWKAVSVERDTLQRNQKSVQAALDNCKKELIETREQVKCLQSEAATKNVLVDDLMAQVEKNGDWIRYLDQRIDDLTVERDDLLTKQMQIDTEYTKLQKDAHYPRSIAWACGVAFVMLVVLMVAG